MFAKFLFAAIALPALLVRADPNPIVPGPGDSYKEGGTCLIQWDADTTGTWTNMLIELKTGDNLNMVPLKAITTIDGTKQTQFQYPCPNVTPNSAIYFYEFSSNSSTQKYWTTRFAITDQNGNSTPPSQPTQSNGDKIPWGTGALADGESSLLVSSSGPSSLSSGPSSSSLPGSSRISSSPSSRLSSTSTPAPTPSGSTQSSNSNGGIVVAVPKAVILVVGLVVAFL